MIPHVEQSAENLQSLRFSDGPRFADGRVPVLLEWSAENIAAQVPEARRAVDSETGAGTKAARFRYPVRRCSMVPEVSALERVYPGARLGVAVFGMGCHRQSPRRVGHSERQAGLKDRDASDRPVAQYRALPAVSVSEEGYLVVVTKYETVRAVKIRKRRRGAETGLVIQRVLVTPVPDVTTGSTDFEKV